MGLSDFEKNKIITLYEENFSQVEISKKVNVNKSTVSRIIKKYLTYCTTNTLKESGRPLALNSGDYEELIKIIDKTPKMSLRKTAIKLAEETGKQVSHTTVKNSLNSNGIFAYPPNKQPLLKKKNIQSRVEKTEKMLTMSYKELKSIIFSDESKFNLFYSDGKVSVWRKPSTGLELKNLIPTVKFGGGSIMVWGCFSYYGVGKLVFIDGIMDAALYVNILANNLEDSAELMGLSKFIFQQDNDPKHTSKLAKSYFSEKNIDLLPWPPQSPDLNPIETLWGNIKQKLSQYSPKNIEQLKEFIQREWDSITPETCRELSESFKKRIFAVYRARGGHKKY